MSKDSSTNTRPRFQPQVVPVAKAIPANNSLLSNRHQGSAVIVRHLAHASASAEDKSTRELIRKTDESAGTKERSLEMPATVDTKKLQDRITCCLALQANVSREWAISMRLRPDLAPLTRFRLECNMNGAITLSIFSQLRTVVESLHAQIPVLITALAPWSVGTPTVQVTHS